MLTTETKKHYKEKTIAESLERWKNKALHGKFLQITEEIADNKKTWQWVTMGSTRVDVQATIFAAQEQAFTTNTTRARIHGTIKNAKCRLSKDKDDTIDRLTTGCSKIAQSTN